jgi:peroxiredoxin
MVKKLIKDTSAIDFELVDTQGHPVKLSDYKDKSNVVLVFNRGFA